MCAVRIERIEQSNVESTNSTFWDLIRVRGNSLPVCCSRGGVHVCAVVVIQRQLPMRLPQYTSRCIAPQAIPSFKLYFVEKQDPAPSKEHVYLMTRYVHLSNIQLSVELTSAVLFKKKRLEKKTITRGVNAVYTTVPTDCVILTGG